MDAKKFGVLWYYGEMSARILEMLNQLEGEYYGKDNVFYRKIDLENIAITGHSQGGYGVVFTEKIH